MLESMRQRGASIFIYLIFGILIAVFVINFGPQGGQAGGCSSSGNTAIEVDGHDVNLTAYRVALSNPYNPGRGEKQRKYFALDWLIRRELLADAAEQRGIRVTGEMVDEEIKKGFFFVGGHRIPLRDNIFDTHSDGTRTWNGAKFKRWVMGLDVRSTSSYRDEQVRSMQAALMAEVLMSTARASREEALSDYLFNETTVTYDYVAFSPQQYRAAMRLTPADIERFASTHEAEVKAKFAADERTYKGTSAQAKLRQVFIAKAPDAAAGSAAPAAPKAGEPMPIDAAKAKLEAARAQIAAGKQKLADVASQLSTDANQRAMGGDMGWRSVDNAGLGDTAVNDAVKALKAGELTQVIATDTGVYLVAVEDTRSGDLAFEKVRLEIAESLARDVWSKEAAKRAALQALADSKSKKLEELFQLEDAGFQMPKGLEINGGEQLTPEMRKQIEEMIKNNKSGAIEWESSDIPAKSQDASAPAGSAAPTPGSAAPTPTPAAGAPTPAAAGAPTPAPAAAPALTASTDVLPAFDLKAKPMVTRVGPETRKTVMPGLDLATSPLLFDTLSDGAVADKVLEIGDAYVVLQLLKRGQPSVEDFEKSADATIAAMHADRGRVVVDEFVTKRCEQLAKDGKIVPMADLIRETDEKGSPIPTSFRPCTAL